MDVEAFILAIEIIGIIAFSVSGAVVSIHHQMDVFGVVFLAVITTFGGGIMRDAISDVPLAFFAGEHAAIDAVVCVGTAFVVYFAAMIFKKFYVTHEELISRVNNVFDALGLGLFAVYGTQIAVKAESTYLTKWPVAIFLGMLTCIGGGMIRDVCLGGIPFVLRKRIYALAAIGGSASYYFIYRAFPQLEVPAMLIGTVVCFTLRICATVFKWNMPCAVKASDYLRYGSERKDHKKEETHYVENKYHR